MRWADIEVANRTVAIDARVRLLCYPRGSFYLLSSVLPTKDRRITKTYFRTCLSRHSRSQAGLCFYTLCTMSIRTKPTFVPLRYLLARYRPSKTANLALFPPPFPGGMSKPRIFQRVVLHWCPKAPTYSAQLKNTKAIPSYSKAPRGLFVLVE